MSFDEQPDGDIHGECAFEIHRLEQQLAAKDVENERLENQVLARNAELWGKLQEILGLKAQLANREKMIVELRKYLKKWAFTNSDDECDYMDVHELLNSTADLSGLVLCDAEPVAWGIFVEGEPCDVGINKQDIELEFSRRNRFYPETSRQMLSLYKAREK